MIAISLQAGLGVALQVDVISDVVCPWCYIGKRRLARALELYREQNPQAPSPVVNWHPFQLNPDLPEGGLDRAEYLRRKFGGRADEIYAHITAVGKTVGISFAFDKLVRQPNTLAAHSLIGHAAEAGLQDALVEALFRAYFIEGEDLTSAETLSRIAGTAGLEPAGIAACLASAEAREGIRSADLRARELGVEGVPFFVINQRYAVSGAQEPEVLFAAMLQVEREDEESSPGSV
jgi:predicted DsbA family dithiol-disulfide isomerase